MKNDFFWFYKTVIINNLLNKTFHNSFFLQRNHVPDFWKWLLEILLPRLYISKRWNNIPVDDTEKRMIATRVAYRVGPVRIRQQRVRQGMFYYVYLLHN